MFIIWKIIEFPKKIREQPMDTQIDFFISTRDVKTNYIFKKCVFFDKTYFIV